MEQAKSRAQAPATSLHDLVVDYVINNAYAGTARVLATSKPVSGAASSSLASSSSPTPREMEVDAREPALGSTLDKLKSGAGDKDTTGAMDVDSDDRPDTSAAENRRAGQSPAPLDEATLLSIEQRRSIIDYILSGAIVRAVDALQTSFPGVLNPKPAETNGAAPSSSSSSAASSHRTVSNGAKGNGAAGSSSNSTSYVVAPRPARTSTTPSTPGDNHSTPVFARSTEADHVRLNLQIQQFIESFRQIVPSAPSSPTSSIGSLNGSSSGSSNAPLEAALLSLQRLHADATRLRPDHRAVYLQEIKDVGGLLAYTDPENSTLGGFLDQARRIALAQQVNAAILRSEGRAVQSYLEQIARRTSAVYETITEKAIDPHPTWTGSDAKGAAHWRIAEQLKRRPFQRGGFSLHEFVWEMV